MNSTGGTDTPEWTAPKGRSRFPAGMKDALARTSALELRSLALFRIGLGLVVLMDLLQRLRYFGAFYHPEGIVPLGAGSLGLHPVLAGVDGHVLSLPIVLGGILAAVCFTLGVKARTMAAICWMVLAFLNARNWMILHLADRLVLLFLMWAVLLPTARRWGVEARDRGNGPAVHFSPAAVGLHLQVVVVYFTGALLKARQPTWRDGSHLGGTLERIEYLSAPGMILRDLTFLHTPATWAVLGLQLFGGLLLLTPWRYTALRVGLIGALALLQVGMGTALNVGLFPWISIVGLVALLPPGFWERGLKAKPRAPSPPPVQGRLARRLRGIAALLLITVMALETLNDHLHLRSSSGFVGDLPGGGNFMQRWTMFTGPATHAGWFLVPALTAEGDTINLLRKGDPLSYQPPSDPWNDFRSHRWRILLANSLRGNPRPEYRERFLRYLMEEWNEGVEPRLRVESLQLVEMRFPLAPTADPYAATPTTLASYPDGTWTP